MLKMKKYILQIVVLIILIAVVIWQFIIISDLNHKYAVAKLPPAPSLASYFDAHSDSNMWGGYVSAKGTWDSNLKLAYPYNISEIDCWKQWNNCIVAQAHTTGESFGGMNMIFQDISYYDIESWDTSKIIAKSAALCAETILTVDRTLKKITTITTPINTETEGCKSGAKLIGEIEVQTNVLVDGSSKWIKEFIPAKK